MGEQERHREIGDSRAAAGMDVTRFGVLGPPRNCRLIQTATVLLHQGRALTEAVGLGHLLQLPENGNLPSFPSAEAAQAWEDAVLEAFRTKDADEWVKILESFEDVPFELVVTSEEGTFHPQICTTATSSLSRTEHGAIREIGPIAH
jgi:hypothetical protein